MDAVDTCTAPDKGFMGYPGIPSDPKMGKAQVLTRVQGFLL